jgi:hypothetical protein
MACGDVLDVSEYAHMSKIDDEVLILGFPISSKTRLRPTRGSTIDIQIKQGKFQCFSTGIHTDIPEWGVSMSIFLIIKEQN